MAEKIKIALIVFCVVAAYGLVGRMDYTDELELENTILQERMAQCGPHLRGLHMATVEDARRKGQNHVQN